MQMRQIFALAVTAMGVASAKERCAAPEPTEAQIEASKKFLEQEREARLAGNLTTRATIEVNVYFHVVASAQTTAGGYLTVSPPDPMPRNITCLFK